MSKAFFFCFSQTYSLERDYPCSSTIITTLICSCEVTYLGQMDQVIFFLALFVGFLWFLKLDGRIL